MKLQSSFPKGSQIRRNSLLQREFDSLGRCMNFSVHSSSCFMRQEPMQYPKRSGDAGRRRWPVSTQGRLSWRNLHVNRRSVHGWRRTACFPDRQAVRCAGSEDRLGTAHPNEPCGRASILTTEEFQGIKLRPWRAGLLFFWGPGCRVGIQS